MVKDFLNSDDIRSLKKVKNSNDYFKELRSHLESKGVFVIQMGDLGSHHSRVSVEEFRGMAIADRLAPIIVINPNDTLNAKVFTLVHELCHLGLGKNIISNEFYTKQNKIEVFCNAVAAEVLVPSDELQVLIVNEITSSFIDNLAKKFCVSSIVIARRLLELNYITEQEYQETFNKYVTLSQRKQAKSSKGGPDSNIVAKARLGNKLIKTILNATYNGTLDFSDASSVLNLPISRFSKVYEEM